MRVRLPRVTAGRLGNQTKGLIGNLIIAILAACITAGAYIYFHNRKPYNAPNAVYQANSIQQQVKDMNRSAQDNLANKDYAAYQQFESNSAQQLIMSKDYDGAENLLNEVVSNVPKDKIISATYRAYIALAVAKNDKQQIAHYDELIIPLLQKEGDTKSAQAFQQQLESVK